MSKDTMVLTRKIQLHIDSSDKEFIKSCYQKLYQWQYICFRGANYIFTHHFIQEQIKSLFYLNDEVKVKLSDIKKDQDGILTTSKANTTYQVLSKNFKGEIPTKIISALNHSLLSYFNKEKDAYWKGEKSIRNYKKTIPIPFPAYSLLPIVDKGKYFTFILFQIPFKTYLGKDFSDKRILLKKVIEGEVELCTSSIKLQDNKIYWQAAFRFKKDCAKIKEGRIAEATLSYEYPIVVHIDKKKYCIGNRDEFLYRRLAIQAARQRAQRNSTFNKPGKGRKKKLKSVDRFNQMEKDYINYRLHVYSRRLIDLCVKYQAAALLLVDQRQKEEEVKEDEFLLRNWSFFNLKAKVLYKAEKAGIKLIEE